MVGFDRHKEHKHKWFEEALCELASLFVLYRLATAWDKAPPPDIVAARDFAPNHRAYAEEIQDKYGGVLNNRLRDWLAMNIDLMEADPCKRDLNGVVAVSLLRRFRRDPSLWRDCGSLNRWDPSVDATFADYLDSWAACLRAEGRNDRVAEIVRKTFRPKPLA